jgi:ribosomal protein L34E
MLKRVVRTPFGKLRTVYEMEEDGSYCPKCGAQGFIDDMLTGGDCCIGVVMEEA